MIVIGNARSSRFRELGENLVTFPGKDEIFFGESAGIMRGERERHLVKTDVNIGMVIDFLSALGDAVHKGNAHQESLELKCPMNSLGAFRPVWNGF